MRWNQSCAVQKFVRSALAFSCLSVIPLAGCSNNSSRNFTLGLREEAAKNAIIAEEQLAEQKAREAGGATAEQSNVEPSTQESRRSPLLSFLRGEPKTSGDPFLDSKSEAVATTEKPSGTPAATSESRDKAAWNDEGVLQVNGTRTESPNSESSWDAVMKEYLAEGAQAERPAWEQAVSSKADQEIPSLTEPFLKNETTAAADNSEFAWARNSSIKTESRIVGPEPPVDLTGPAPETKVAANDVAPWAASSPAIPQVEAPSPSPTAHRVPVARIVDEGQATKLRIQSLLSQSHSDLLRGDTYSAYRSALLAQQETEKHNVHFGAGEERPSELVNQISRKLWGNQAIASTEATPHQIASATPAASPVDWGQPQPVASQTPPSQNSIFNEVTQSEWIAVPEGPAGMPSVTPQLSSNTGPAFPAATPSQNLAADPDVNRLPDIRVNENRRIQRLSADVSEETSGFAKLAYEELEQVIPAEPVTQTPDTVSNAPWGIVQKTAKTPAPTVAESRSLSAPSWTEWSAMDSSGTVENSVRGSQAAGWQSAMVQAPAPPAEFQVTAPAPLQPAPATQVVVHTKEQVTARTGGSNSKWAIFGFIAALAATVLGLRARRETA